MVKKVDKRGRPSKTKLVASRAASVALAPSKAKAKAKSKAKRPPKAATAAGSGSGSAAGAAVECTTAEPCVFPCPCLRRVPDEALPQVCAVHDSQDEEAGIRILGGEDLDALQLELETLLSSVAVRLCQLNEQLTVLNSIETTTRGRGRKQRKTLAIIATPAPAVSTPPPEDKPTICRPPVKAPMKKLGNIPPPAPSPSLSNSSCKRSKMLRKRPEMGGTTKPKGKQLEKDFVSHKFWTTLDPYCCEVTEDTYNLLSDILCQNQEEVPFLYNIPPLGEHFSKEWDVKDFVENHEYGHASPSLSSLPPSSPSSNSTTSSPTAESIGSAIRRKFRECSLALKRTLCTSPEKPPPPASPPPTPATSKLMAALLGELPPPIIPLQESKEHNVIVKIEKDDDEKVSPKNSRPNSVSGSSSNSEMPLKHQRKCLDRKYCLEKEAQGDIDCSIRDYVPPQSLLDELKRTQAELKLVVDQNNQVISGLTNVILDELKVQNLKRKLQEIDDSVLDIYHSRTAAKLAKETISQDNIDRAWKALKERDHIIRQIDFFEQRWASKNEV
ncbi:transcriptional adapter 3-like [Thrips palmi]|uniref:Transcriptional adapter 3-like n=1 Tax=Thrips palmi TaxID=161013 RepID=A0A6P9A1W0_THRPL|nr:transcriptional adapter 3-like [Thrips palmi]